MTFALVDGKRIWQFAASQDIWFPVHDSGTLAVSSQGGERGGGRGAGGDRYVMVWE